MITLSMANSDNNPLLSKVRIFLGLVLAFFVVIAVLRPEYLNDPESPVWRNISENLAFLVLLIALLMSSWPLPGRQMIYLVGKVALCFLLVTAAAWPADWSPAWHSIAALGLFLFFWLVFPRSAEFWNWVRPLSDLPANQEKDA